MRDRKTFRSTDNVSFTATDDGNGTGITKATSLTVPISVLNSNRAPQINEFSNITLNRGEVKELVLQATDADGDSLVLQLKAESAGYGIPDFVRFIDNGDRTATLRLAPGINDGGNYSFTLTATDNGNGGGTNAIQSDEYTFVVSVNAPNDPPRLPVIGNKVAVVGETLEFIVKASDRNQDNLSFNLSGLPVGATLTPTGIYGEAQFRWTPTAADINTYPVTIAVSDSGNGNPNEVLVSQQQFNLIVRTANTTPVLEAIANQTLAEGETVRFVKDSAGRLTQVVAPDGSLVVYGYDTQGNLVSARNLASGESSRYGYSSPTPPLSHSPTPLLTLATGTPGTAGEAIAYSTTPQVSPVSSLTLAFLIPTPSLGTLVMVQMQ